MICIRKLKNKTVIYIWDADSLEQQTNQQQAVMKRDYSFILFIIQFVYVQYFLSFLKQ